MKALVIVALWVAASVGTAADWKSRPFRVSQVIYIGANAADIASSRGSWEANPLLRSPDGRFGGRGIAIKSGVLAGILATQWICHRKLGHRVELPFTATNLMHSAVMATVVRNNLRIRAKRE
jgi:hypothetical protein